VNETSQKEKTGLKTEEITQGKWDMKKSGKEEEY
jgi:hypothetical protein